jgi:hyperosmotically inducible protein
MDRVTAFLAARACAFALLAAACGDVQPDGRIASLVEQELDNSPVLSDTQIDVASRDGVVTLTGVVANEGQAAQAERIARSVEGVEQVESRLEVTAPSEPGSPPPVAAPPPPPAGEVR